MKKWTWDDTDRVVFVIGALIGAAFLLALCVFLIQATRADAHVWAAWAQVVGTVSAVLVAVFVSRHQAKLSRELLNLEWEQTRRDVAQQRVEILKAIAETARLSLRPIDGACNALVKVENIEEVEGEAEKWREALGLASVMLERLAIHEFPGALVARHVLNLRHNLENFKIGLTPRSEVKESLRAYRSRVKNTRDAAESNYKLVKDHSETYEG